MDAQTSDASSPPGLAAKPERLAYSIVAAVHTMPLLGCQTHFGVIPDVSGNRSDIAHRLQRIFAVSRKEIFAADQMMPVIRVYDEAGNVIKTHEHKGRFQRVVGSTLRAIRTSPRVSRAGRQLLPWPAAVAASITRSRLKLPGFERGSFIPRYPKCAYKTWSVDKMVDKDSSCMKHLH